jgi:hypothetical protein
VRVSFPASKGEWQSRGVKHYPEPEDWSYLFPEGNPVRISAIRHNGQPMVSRDRTFGEQERLLTAVLVKASPPTEIEKKVLAFRRALEAEYQEEVNPRCLWCRRRKREITHRETVTYTTSWGTEHTEKLARRSPCSVSLDGRHRWSGAPIV